MAQADYTDQEDDDSYSAADVRSIMKLAQGRSPLPEDFRIPRGAWNLLSKEVRDNFLTERTKALEDKSARLSSGSGLENKATPIPKQYGRQAHLTLTQDGGEDGGTQPQNDDSDEEEDDEEILTRVMKSYKATRNLNRFAGMAKTRTHTTRDIHVHLDKAKVRALVSKLTQTESVALSDGGCNTTLLGDGWYITEYTGTRSASIVGFDEFAARKSGLPIVTGITKYELPDRKGHILLRLYESVYNKGSRTTLLSEFQLRDRRCIVDNTYKGHRGADYKAGTQRIETPDDDRKNSFVIPLRLRAALMTMRISLPTEHDLETLPIVDITSPGLWMPSEHNEINHGLSFEDPIFVPYHAAQHTANHGTTATLHSLASGELIPTTDVRLGHTTRGRTTTRLDESRTPEPPSITTRPGADPTPTPLDPDIPLHFFDARDELDLHGPCSFDHSNPSTDIPLDSHVFHLSIDYEKVIASSDVNSFLEQLDFAELRGGK
jgi:hypothetical protein